MGGFSLGKCTLPLISELSSLDRSVIDLPRTHTSQALPASSGPVYKHPRVRYGDSSPLGVFQATVSSTYFVLTYYVGGSVCRSRSFFSPGQEPVRLHRTEYVAVKVTHMKGPSMLLLLLLPWITEGYLTTVIIIISNNSGVRSMRWYFFM